MCCLFPSVVIRQGKKTAKKLQHIFPPAHPPASHPPRVTTQKPEQKNPRSKTRPPAKKPKHLYQSPPIRFGFDPQRSSKTPAILSQPANRRSPVDNSVYRVVGKERQSAQQKKTDKKSIREPGRCHHPSSDTGRGAPCDAGAAPPDPRAHGHGPGRARCA